MKKFTALLIARNKEFVRDRGSMAWSLLFPFLIIIGFSFAFSGQNQDIFKVAVHSTQSAAVTAQELSRDFMQTKFINFIDTQELKPAIEKLQRHQYDMVISLGSNPKYWINASSPKGYLLEKIIKVQDSQGKTAFSKEQVSGREIRYVDWLIAGLLGMNVMFGSLFGVGYVIVRYRKSGVLRRLKATPVSAFEFLSAQVVSRLLLMITACAIVLAGCRFLVDLKVAGSYLDLFTVLLVGALCMISLALVVASRISSEEFAGGLLNVLTWPMMLFSGVWFSMEGANPLLQQFSRILPLTHLVDASRLIITEGAGLTQVSGHLFLMLVLTAVFMLISSLLFRWE
ncbi:MAG: ABC transporter permease [Proteobacteria bacterium]|nr:ABC transporter permease [Pseudomonadota bacterium]